MNYPRGVNLNHQTEERLYHGRKVNYQTRFHNPIPKQYSKNNLRKGVRKDNVDLCGTETRFDRELRFDRPCICGSFLHRSTRSSNCLLNKQFLDD